MITLLTALKNFFQCIYYNQSILIKLKFIITTIIGHEECAFKHQKVHKQENDELLHFIIIHNVEYW